MVLFQNSVLNKYLKGLESEKVNDAYERFTSHFHNPTIQENIRNSKEEQYQGEFLIDLFVNVLGYTKNPTPDFNLTTELKNIKGSKKTDGAILKGKKALAVIELKGTDTTDLNKVETQAFGYKNNQPGCNYVITSNFEKLRFYIDNAVDYEEFNLFQLSRERFEILWLCLSSEYLLKDIPKKIKNESLTQEELITKKLYKDYASFRNEIFDAIQKENPKYNKLTLFKKTQKLLDRFLFIFFAEDRLLLPPNSIREIINQWKKLKDLDEYRPLYARFKKYFGYLNTGYKGKKHDIFAYNGGLFAPDEILDNIKINDDLLYKHTQLLSNYDFESEVSVNILGHIFEHSLTDLENIQAQIEGEEVDKSKTKRKKDGVFYTPKYITKYIVDNTVGKLCEEKKTELNITDERFTEAGRRTKKGISDLDTYRDWLLQLTICDPACGSGAFLNQALEFLIAEHQYIDELTAKYHNSSLVLSDIENAILENNLFGVDINEESVEIAKLSLWLRTAQKGRKLTSLNNNIKCGNSLIDDPTVAGDKAFNWENEFSEVFAKGGFDVIIGNPPYGMDQNRTNGKYYKEAYKLIEGRDELFELFIERSFELFNIKGVMSFIIPNTLLSNLYSKKLRQSLIEDYNLLEVTNFGMDVFNDPTVHTCIITLNKDNEGLTNIRKQVESQNELDFEFDYQMNAHKFLETENKTIDIFFNPVEFDFIKKLDKNIQLKEVCFIRQCIKTGNDKVYVKNSTTSLREPWKKTLRGKSINRYLTSEHDLYLKYGDWLARNWKNKTFYETNKIVIRETGKRITATLDLDNHYLLSSLYSIYPKNDFKLTYLKSLLAIINSNLANFYIKKIAYELTKGAFTKVRTNQLGRLPIARIQKQQELRLSILVDKIIRDNSDLWILTANLVNLIASKFSLQTTRKLQAWNELDFGEFLIELEKARKKSANENETEYSKLSLSEEAEWMQYFNAQKQKAEELKAEIDKTDREIDAMVYELYGLTEEEIAIVEEATK